MSEESVRQTRQLGIALVALACVSLLGLTGIGLIAFGIPGVLALCLARLAMPKTAASLALRRGPAPATWLAQHVLKLAIGSAVAVWLALFLGMGWRKEVAYRVWWETGTSSSQYPGEAEVTVHFEDYPGNHLVYYSRDLATCLAQHPTNRGVALLELTLDFGRLRSFREMEVAGCSTLKGVYGSSFGQTGEPDRSPFDEYR